MCCCSRKCIEVFEKILQLLVIVAIIIFITNFFTNIGKMIILLVVLIVIYIVFIIVEFRSPLCKFLCNKTNNVGLKSKLGEMFKSGPVFKLHCECYHYEVKTVRHSPLKRKSKPAKKSSSKKGGARKSHSKGGGRSKGVRHHSRTTTKVKKVVTHRETVTFPYKSCRDISGVFTLDCGREKAMGKVYVKLDLNNIISFADEASKNDYERFKNNFYNRNRNRDKEMSFNESKSLPGFEPYSFICIRDSEPCGVNICLYILFTLIPLTELYKSYVNSYCIEQTFTIKKLISTTENLNVNKKYDSLTPSIDIPSEKYTFAEDEYMYDYEQPKEEADLQNEYLNGQFNYPDNNGINQNNQNNNNMNNQVPPSNNQQQIGQYMIII